jgi:hypothetical protein
MWMQGKSGKFGHTNKLLSEQMLMGARQVRNDEACE